MTIAVDQLNCPGREFTDIQKQWEEANQYYLPSRLVLVGSFGLGMLPVIIVASSSWGVWKRLSVLAVALPPFLITLVASTRIGRERGLEGWLRKDIETRVPQQIKTWREQCEGDAFRLSMIDAFEGLVPEIKRLAEGDRLKACDYLFSWHSFCGGNFKTCPKPSILTHWNRVTGSATANPSDWNKAVLTK